MTANVALLERPQTTLELPEVTPPTIPEVQPVCTSEVYWGDRIMLKFWVFCFVVMWFMHALDVMAGIWRG
jgi:hypothetical protein